MNNAAVAQFGSSVRPVSERSEVRSLAAAPSTITAHQPVYLPWLGYFAKLVSADRFFIFDVCQFERHGFENRVKIKTQQGPKWLTVPVDSSGLIIKNGWQRKHVRAIEQAYGKARYFEQYRYCLKPIERNWIGLGELNDCLLGYMLHALGIKAKIEHASIYEPQGSKSYLVLDLCRKVRAKKYIFGSQGVNYADVKAFTDAGIEVEFQSYVHPRYTQLHGGPFIPGLSILDLLFNEGPNSLEILRGKAGQ